MSMHDIITLRNSTEEMKLSLLLALHCAPLLLGLKAANIITVTRQEFLQIKNIFKGTEVSYRFLRIKGEKGIIYLYREQEIKKYLFLEEVQYFLKEYGYRTGCLDEMLKHLEERIFFYRVGQISFPHEIGIFLEYPIMDVKGFLENKGENFICSGYWKVYAEEEKTIRKFHEYDVVRELAVREVLSGKKIREIML